MILALINAKYRKSCGSTGYIYDTYIDIMINQIIVYELLMVIKITYCISAESGLHCTNTPRTFILPFIVFTIPGITNSLLYVLINTQTSTEIIYHYMW